MKMKLIASAISLVMAVSFVPSFAFAEDGSTGVKISSDNFSDAKFRSYVAENFDKDGNGYLSKGEVSGVTTIDVSKIKGISELEGIEYFKDRNTVKIPKGASVDLSYHKGVTVYEGNDISINDEYNNVVVKNANRKMYTGKAIKPEVKSVTVNGKKLLASTYTVKYSENKETGFADITIKAKSGSGYTGETYSFFEIYPKTPTIAKATAGKKALTIKMKTKAAAKHGKVYEVAYKVKGTSKWKYKISKKQTITIKSLKKGKAYQVKVRAVAYPRVKDKKEASIAINGKWSKTKVTSKIK